MWESLDNQHIKQVVYVYRSLISSGIYGTSHMQRHTRRRISASMRAKWVRHCTTLLVRVLIRACVLLSFVRALANIAF